MIRKSISATSKYFKYDIICQFVKMKKIDLINDVFFFYKQLLLINTYLICESDLNSDFGKANNANIYYVIDPLIYHTSQVIIYFLITKNIFKISSAWFSAYL